jgi:long-chain fatty acid transport protein
MEFTPAGMPGERATITFFQDWDDQTVFSIGGAYQATDALVLRAGANISSNPIPDEFVNPLFPAIVEKHFTAGFGYAFDQANDLNFSLTYAPDVTVTNSNTGVEISHSQLNWQMMYSYSF